MWYVYFIKSNVKDWYYVGSTNRLEERVAEHNKGKVLSTKAYRPFELVFSRQFKFEQDARSYERRLKEQRVEKERIIKELEK
jgi:putative endonuclease